MKPHAEIGAILVYLKLFAGMERSTDHSSGGEYAEKE
jgi:hypothetical protein